MIQRFEQFVTLISGIYRDIQKIERIEMESYGLKGAYAQYLLAMRRFPDGVTAAQLCEICDKDKAAVSRAIAEMEEKGLICRNGSTYRAPLSLTKEGDRAAEYVCSKAVLAVSSASINEADRTLFYAALESVALKLQSIAKEGIPEE